MDPERIVEAVFGVFVTIILIYVFAEVIFNLQGLWWTALFVLLSIAILISYIIGEL